MHEYELDSHKRAHGNRFRPSLSHSPKIINSQIPYTIQQPSNVPNPIN